jgi:hypothetical protein
MEEHEFPLWDEFVYRSQEGTLFHSHLWLQALGYPFKLLGCFRGQELRAGFAIAVINDNRAAHPESALTPYLGIVHAAQSEKYVTRLSTQKEMTAEFARYLMANFNAAEFRFPPEVIDLQPFIWAGFDAGVRYTYRLPLASTEVLLENMDATRRRNILKAEKMGIRVQYDSPFEDIMRLVEKTFQRQGHQASFRAAALAVESQLRPLRRCMGFVARNESGLDLGAVWIVWDNKRAYYLLGGYDPAMHSSDAVSLAMWHAIRYTALELNLKEFDFEGSMIVPVERFFRKFGGTLMPTFTVKFERPTGLVDRLARKLKRFSHFQDTKTSRQRPLPTR